MFLGEVKLQYLPWNYSEQLAPENGGPLEDSEIPDLVSPPPFSGAVHVSFKEGNQKILTSRGSSPEPVALCRRSPWSECFFEWGFGAGFSQQKWNRNIWGFPKMVGFPNWPMGFPTRNDQNLGCELGVPPFKETPIWDIFADLLWGVFKKHSESFGRFWAFWDWWGVDLHVAKRCNVCPPKILWETFANLMKRCQIGFEWICFEKSENETRNRGDNYTPKHRTTKWGNNHHWIINDLDSVVLSEQMWGFCRSVFFHTKFGLNELRLGLGVQHLSLPGAQARSKRDF